MSSLSERWFRAVPSLRAAALRTAFLRSQLETVDEKSAAVALDELCGRAEQADPRAREVLAAAIPLLTDPALATKVDALRALARDQALLPLARLLRRKAQAQAQLAPEPDERQLPAASNGRVLTLGERKALARRPSRAALDKLLRDPHPMVIRTLLSNPRLTEDDVVRLAARRPAFPDVIAEIARSPEWMQRVRVRMAIIQNPGAPPEIAVPMVGLLIRPELARVVAAADVAPIVRAAAAELLGRRPPVPDRREPPGRMQ